MFFMIGAASTALSYLSSLQSQATSSTSGSGSAFDPGTLGTQQTKASTASPSSAGGANKPLMSAGTFGALLAAQSDAPPAAGPNSLAHRLFQKLDTDGDGTVSKDEFARLFGAADSTSTAGTNQTQALFDKIDTDHDGTLSESELSKALKGHGRHRHRPMNDGLAELLGQNATSTTATNADGTTTTIYALQDGTKVAVTKPATAANSTTMTGTATA